MIKPSTWEQVKAFIINKRKTNSFYDDTRDFIKHNKLVGRKVNDHRNHLTVYQTSKITFHFVKF